MAAVTSNATVANRVASQPAGVTTVRIEPPRGWFNLRLQELWRYRELLYFFVWRDVKIRYKQTAIGVVWVILQPLLTMLVAWLFFGRLAKLPSQGLPYPVFSFAGIVPWTYFATALVATTGIAAGLLLLATAAAGFHDLAGVRRAVAGGTGRRPRRPPAPRLGPAGLARASLLGSL